MIELLNEEKNKKKRNPNTRTAIIRNTQKERQKERQTDYRKKLSRHEMNGNEHLTFQRSRMCFSHLSNLSFIHIRFHLQFHQKTDNEKEKKEKISKFGLK